MISNVNNNINLILDKYTNLLYTSITNKFNNLNILLFINKFIYKLNFINKKFLKFKSNYMLIRSFNNILTKTIKFLDIFNSIDIVVNKILYPNLLVGNKLMIKTSNFKNTIIYIPNIKNVNISIDKNKNKLINLSSKNLHYVTNLALLIKNIKKIDLCTGIGMYYSNEKIIFKRKSLNAIKK